MLSKATLILSVRPLTSQIVKFYCTSNRLPNVNQAPLYFNENRHRYHQRTSLNKLDFSPRRWYTPVIVVPNMGDSIKEGRIQEWKKKVGESCKSDEPVVSIETDKVTMEVKAPSNGVITKILANEGDDVRVGQNLFEFEEGASPTVTPKETPPSSPPTSTPTEPPPPTRVSTPPPAPPVSTPTSRPASTPTAPPPTIPPQKPTDYKLGSREEKRVKMTKMRQRIAQRLKDSQNTAAMLTTFNEIDMHNITEMRNKFKDLFEKKYGTKLGFMSAFVRAASIALKEIPVVNAFIDQEYIVYRDYHDISVAVATPNGLVVPVLRNAETMSFVDIEKTIAKLVKMARDNELAIEDMAGGTFTISNGGVFGSLFGTPIINPPQSAILGMHSITKRAHVVGDEIKIRPIMFVALTYDHRLIDGREAVLFLKKIKSCIEEPESMLFEV